MKWRVTYKRVYSTQKEAERDLKDVKNKAKNPVVKQGLSGGYLIVLYESDNRVMIDRSVEYYTKNGLLVFVNKA